MKLALVQYQNEIQQTNKKPVPQNGLMFNVPGAKPQVIPAPVAVPQEEKPAESDYEVTTADAKEIARRQVADAYRSYYSTPVDDDDDDYL